MQRPPSDRAPDSLPDLPEVKEEEEDDDEEKDSSDAAPQCHPFINSEQTHLPPPPQRTSSKFSPLPWKGHFDEELDLMIPGTENIFHVYLAGNEGPVIFCIHGGGYSGVSFALVAGLMKHQMRIVAMDLRGHGSTQTQNDADLSIETLCNDVFAVIDALYGNSAPAIVFIGHRLLIISQAHLFFFYIKIEKLYVKDYQRFYTSTYYSLGGAVAVHCAAKRKLSTLAALVVLDVVEGTALASLSYMQSFLSHRPSHFSSLEKAIEWSVRGGSLRNVDSARVSVASTLKYNEVKKCYTWITPLEETEPYWKGWYQGLSDLFLSTPVPKMLILAGTDRLDRTLTIGQMQGKFQMVVLRNTGHAIQEDVPDELSRIVLGFISRNRITASGVKIPRLHVDAK